MINSKPNAASSEWACVWCLYRPAQSTPDQYGSVLLADTTECVSSYKSVEMEVTNPNIMLKELVIMRLELGHGVEGASSQNAASPPFNNYQYCTGISLFVVTFSTLQR